MGENRVCMGYQVIKSKRFKTAEVVLAHNPNAVQPYVTWKAYAHRQFQDITFGHYFSKRKDAEKDFQRCVEELRADLEPPRRKPPQHGDMER